MAPSLLFRIGEAVIDGTESRCKTVLFGVLVIEIHTRTLEAGHVWLKERRFSVHDGLIRAEIACFLLLVVL